jgi:transcriptional regulator with XRE-family HTH domain
VTSPGDNALGDFLRARRAAARPDFHGASSRGRRVAGLRREEVAVFADVSVDYYARLEQGRERGPSAQVLSAVARALALDDDSTRHLFLLAGVLPERRGTAPRRVSGQLRQLLDSFTHAPAFVIDPRLDIVAANAVTDRLFAPFAVRDNLLRMIFDDPAAGVFYRDWSTAAEGAVASLREGLGAVPGDAGIIRLVSELEANPEFAAMWSRQDVRGKTRAAKEFRHPEVGDLSLTYQAFDVRDAPGLQLVVYLAEPATASADSLALLATVSTMR